jgi:hypothetical protein
MIKQGMAAMAALMVGMTAGSAMAGLSGENVLSPLPPGFKVGSSGATPTGSMSEYIPQAETVHDWSAMITVMVMHVNATPDQFAAGMLQSIKGGCAGIQSRKVTDGTENGYAFSIWLVQCPLNPATGKPEGFAMKIIGGKDALYNIQYAFRQNLTADLSKPAMIYLRRVQVCDTRSIDHPCPPGM